jgi:hypothetical protein
VSVWDSARHNLRLRTRLVRHGKRTVLGTYPGLRLGNYLYFFLHAYASALRGSEYRVLDTGLAEEWYAAFPALRGLSVNRTRIYDQREHIPPLFYQAYGQDFTQDELTRFVRDILPIPGLLSFDPDTVTVNVRRGDYYQSPERSDEFGFDIPSYLTTAFGLAEARGPLNRVVVVSDDVEWAGRAVTAARPNLDHCELIHGSPVEQFLILARSPRLILANSTFSYWGAYLSDVIHGQADVWAPDLHSRAAMAGRAWQHAPWWTTVATVPIDTTTR